MVRTLLSIALPLALCGAHAVAQPQTAHRRYFFSSPAASRTSVPLPKPDLRTYLAAHPMTRRQQKEAPDWSLTGQPAPTLLKANVRDFARPAAVHRKRFFFVPRTALKPALLSPDSGLHTFTNRPATKLPERH